MHEDAIYCISRVREIKFHQTILDGELGFVIGHMFDEAFWAIKSKYRGSTA